MELTTLLVVGLIAACCVIPMLFMGKFMGKRGSKTSADKPDNRSNKS